MKSKKVSLNYNKKIAKQTKKLNGGGLFYGNKLAKEKEYINKLAKEKEYIKKLQDHVINYNSINNNFITGILKFYENNSTVTIADLIREFTDKTQILNLRFNRDFNTFYGNRFDSEFQKRLTDLENKYSGNIYSF